MPGPAVPFRNTLPATEPRGSPILFSEILPSTSTIPFCCSGSCLPCRSLLAKAGQLPALASVDLSPRKSSQHFCLLPVIPSGSLALSEVACQAAVLCEGLEEFLDALFFNCSNIPRVSPQQAFSLKGSSLPIPVDSARACKSSWCSRPCDREVPAPCECHNPLTTALWQRNAGACDNWPVLRCPQG